MDTIPGNDPMSQPPHTPLAGLNPVDLLRQGAAEDTFLDGEPSAFHPPSVDELASLFPQFEILELIGQGGMGVVYKVRQKELDRIVALKILPPAIGQSPAFSNRFAREAKALAKLNHPGIVTIHEFGQTSSSQLSTPDSHPLYFILMEFVDGVNLAQLMKTGRISPREALAIVPQICDALQFAHDQGIVHRDIKPENILLDRLGRVKVADFGIAKLVGAVSEEHGQECPCPLGGGDIPVPTFATIDGKIMGTPQYMAPEQIEHPSEVDHRADIYALGVVFYQMLTGELPGTGFEAPSRKVHIDVRLDEIVLKAMEKDPELRFQQVSVMRTRVDEVGSKSAEEPELKSERATAKTRSTGRMVAIGCGVLSLVGVLLLLFLSASFWLIKPTNKPAAIQMNDKSQTHIGESRDPNTEGLELLGAFPNSSISEAASFDPVGLADHFVNLELGAIEAKSIYLDDHPVRKVTEEMLREFLDAHPDFPNNESRKIVVQRRAEMAMKIIGLSRQFGSGQSEILSLQRVLERLGDLSEIGEKQLADESAEVVLAADLPKGNRLQIRKVVPNDADAEMMWKPSIEVDGTEIGKEQMRVSREVIVWGQHVENSGVIAETDDNRLEITLNRVGGKRLAEATKPGSGELRLAIIIDGKVKSAPIVNARLLGRKLQVNGFKSAEEAFDVTRSFPGWDQGEEISAAYQWLINIDAEKYSESYDISSEFFKNAVTREQWDTMLAGFRRPLGMGSQPRNLLRVDELQSLPGVPEGEYRLIQFQTDFLNKKGAVETVVLAKEKDGVWRSVGYFIY